MVGDDERAIQSSKIKCPPTPTYGVKYTPHAQIVGLGWLAVWGGHTRTLLRGPPWRHQPWIKLYSTPVLSIHLQPRTYLLACTAYMAAWRPDTAIDC